MTILSQKLCGIEPLKPGFKHFRVAPQLGMLNEASAVVPTLYGDIRVDIKKQDRIVNIHVIVPPGTTAVVVLPAGKERYFHREVISSRKPGRENMSYKDDSLMKKSFC